MEHKVVLNDSIFNKIIIYFYVTEEILVHLYQLFPKELQAMILLNKQ